jgi:glyceraldehyde 3-phosphate dehydrogenase
MINVAINGFGRIGRQTAKFLLLEKTINIVAINDLAPISTLAHLFKYDSIHGISQAEINQDKHHLIINKKKIKIFNEKDPAKLPWKLLKVDVVVESTGKFKTSKLASQHLLAGAKKVIISAVPDDETKTIIVGINDDLLKKSDQIISNASCTTNSAAPLISVIDKLCGIVSGYITTVHSYTSDQTLHDQPHTDLRRARAAALSIIPTTTGAAKGVTKVFPKFKDLLGGCGIRVPVPNGSLTDITYLVKKNVTTKQVNDAFLKASEYELKNILQYTEEPIVSVDVIGNKYSCVFDAQLTSVIGKMVKVVGWYDNESGYSARLVDLIKLMNKK